MVMTGGRNLAPRRPSTTRAAVITWWVSCGLWLVAGAALTYATAGELGLLMRLRLPTPPEVSRDVLTYAADEQGRRASFRILLFTDEFRWRLSSFQALDTDPERPSFTPEMKAVLNAAEEIIAVGASSEETPVGMSPAAGRAQEERRAGRRAERIAVWVREALSRPVPVRKLNVGHHAPTGASVEETADQRRVIIILVIDHEPGTNMDQALRAAMARESLRAPIFETLLTRYSLSAGQAFTWVP